jgi:DNA-binding NarL/FixJ family response regulator
VRAVTVVAIDDHELFRQGLSLILVRDPRLRMVGGGSRASDALELAATLAPDVLLLDVDLGGPSARSTIRRIRRDSPGVRIVVLTMHRDGVLQRQLMEAGATDYLTKDIPPKELVERILNATSGPGAGALPAAPASPLRAMLSQRELEVLRLIAQACSNRAIAQELGIAEGTVKRHTTNIYAKLDAESRIDAVRQAGRLGML